MATSVRALRRRAPAIHRRVRGAATRSGGRVRQFLKSRPWWQTTLLVIGFVTVVTAFGSLILGLDDKPDQVTLSRADRSGRVERVSVHRLPHRGRGGRARRPRDGAQQRRRVSAGAARQHRSGPPDHQFQCLHVERRRVQRPRARRAPRTPAAWRRRARAPRHRRRHCRARRGVRAAQSRRRPCRQVPDAGHRQLDARAPTQPSARHRDRRPRRLHRRRRGQGHLARPRAVTRPLARRDVQSDRPDGRQPSGCVRGRLGERRRRDPVGAGDVSRRISGTGRRADDPVHPSDQLAGAR